METTQNITILQATITVRQSGCDETLSFETVAERNEYLDHVLKMRARGQGVEIVETAVYSLS